MGRLFKNIDGAVTVFVTMLLVPAILVSGSAVDLARLHSARSIIMDANQLAANTVLTQYNALLYDLYGLMGVAQDDPILARLLDDYIKVCVFGENTDKRLGTLQVFYGSDINIAEIAFVQGNSLRSADCIRRQIEEYMKFRGPVLIVKEIIEALDNNNLKGDTEIIENKLKIDSDIAALYDKYKELYSAIIAADKCLSITEGISGGSFGAVSSRLDLIRQQFVALRICYSSWAEEYKRIISATEEDGGIDEESEKRLADLEAHYNAILVNIQVYITGGKHGSVWDKGKWRNTSNINVPLETSIENAKKQGDDFKVKFDEVVRISMEIDERNNELKRKIDELERKINAGECSEALKQGFTEQTGTPPMTVIERYRELLKWDNITAMSIKFKDGGYSYIDEKFKPMLDGVEYRNSSDASAGSLSRSEMQGIAGNSQLKLSPSIPVESSRAAVFAGFSKENVTYGMPPGFLKFAEHPGENKAFFDELTIMMNQPQLDPVKIYDGQEAAESGSAEEKQRSLINELLGLVEAAYTGLSNKPLGAMGIDDESNTGPEKMNLLEIAGLIPKALSEPVISVIKDPMGNLEKAGDYLLLLTYCTSVFSNYTTTRPESISKDKDGLDEKDCPKSITGVPISPKVNYFFQSEWEYLYSGYDNAAKNLNAVTRLIFLVRLVCNYITVFSVKEVTTIVMAIRTAFAWNPPLAVILGELVRAAFAVAEALVDVAALRTGHKVPIIKNASKGEWVCSPSGVAKAITNIGTVKAGEKGENENGITYSNYMVFIFIAKAVFYIKTNTNDGYEQDAATELAGRAGDLIEWNMVNYLYDVNADMEKMKDALKREGRFRLEKIQTCLSITTTANVRMLFISMPFAQTFFNERGIAAPGVMPISVTDYRGY